MCIDTNLPWYVDYSLFLTLLTLAGASIVGFLLVRSLFKVKKRTATHYIVVLAGIVFLALVVFMVWVITNTRVKC